ncbi:MAG: hypothetical protein ACE5OS_11905 [Anaerolineae bacterium]
MNSFGQVEFEANPQHYLPLLEQRPGAFEHAKPIRRWRKSWPPAYECLLAHLRSQWPDGRGVREFVRILKLHQNYPADLVTQAVEQALAYGCAHVDGVKLCLHQLLGVFEKVCRFTPFSDDAHRAHPGQVSSRTGRLRGAKAVS